MTEIEQLQAVLATIQKAAKIAKTLGYPDRSGNYDMVESELKEKIAAIEAQQAPVDEWAEIRLEINAFAKSLAEDPTPPGHFTVKTPIMSALIGYVHHLESKIAELENELRCERKAPPNTLKKEWIEITDDPSTWPEMDRLLLTKVTSNVAQETNVCQLAVAQSIGLSLQKYGREFLRFYQTKGVIWRESIQRFEIIEPVGYGIANVSHWMYIQNTKAISAERNRENSPN